MSGIPSKEYFTDMTAWSKRHKKAILVLVILGSESCCEQPGNFSNTLVAHKAPTVHRVGNWDKKISQDFPDWMPNPLWTVWNAQIMLIPYHQEKYNYFTHVARTWHPSGKLCLLLEPKLFSSSFSRFYLILGNCVSSLLMACAVPASCRLMFPCAAISLFTFQTLCAHYILSDLRWFCFPLILKLSSRLMFPSAFHCWLIPDLLTDLLPQTGICQAMKIIYLRGRMTRKIYG